MNLRLYHYWRSSSSWRVRLALAHKKVSAEMVAVSLLDGESESDSHRSRNPLGFVPVLEFLDETNPKKRYLAESLPMIEWLEETYPEYPLLPHDRYDRALVRSLAEIVNSEIHPLQNLTTQLHYSLDPEKRKEWAQHWISEGLRAYEKLASPGAGNFSFGDALTSADLCLYPQLYNAKRFEVSLEPFPTLERILKHAEANLPIYQKTHPSVYEPRS
ncbi:maleylacetoacetate isomerase [bacterium]|nr:MAG: maleylacetoacetate isomerase [bacterium]